MTPTKRNPDIPWLKILDSWRMPFLFVAAVAGATMAIPQIKDSLYGATVKVCVQKQISESMAPVVTELKEVNKSLEYIASVLNQSIPAERMNEINESIAAANAARRRAR